MAFVYSFTAELWAYNGDGPWYFVTLPREYASEIKEFTSGWANRGFGTVKVVAAVSEVSWGTSIFPDKKSGSYLMPIKKEIRTKLLAGSGDRLEVTVRLDDI